MNLFQFRRGSEARAQRAPDPVEYSAPDIQIGFTAASPAPHYPVEFDSKRLSGRTRKMSFGDVTHEIARVKAARESGASQSCDFSGRLLADIDFTAISDLVDEPDLLTGANFSNANLLGCSFGPTILPPRTHNQAIREEKWRDTISAGLARANFSGAYIFQSSFNGADISRANFREAVILHSAFDLSFAAGSYSWMRAKFDRAHIEYCNFRGATIRGSFTNAEIIKCDFTPADLPTFDIKRADQRIMRLGNPVMVNLAIGARSLGELIRAKKDEIDDYVDSGDQNSRQVWNEIFTALKEMNEGGRILIPLRSLIRCRLDQSVFEDSFIFRCAFRATIMEKRVKFDRSTILDVDFTPARIEDLPWQYSIILVLKEKISEVVDGIDTGLISHQLDEFLRQVAEKVEDEAAVIADEIGRENPNGVVATQLATASFDEVMVGETHMSDAVAHDVQFSGGVVSATYFEKTDIRNGIFDDAIFIRSLFDGARLNDVSARNTHFDGDLFDSGRAFRIEELGEYFRDRLDNVGKDSKANAHDQKVSSREAPRDNAGVSDTGARPVAEGLDEPAADEAAILRADDSVQRNFKKYCENQTAYRRSLRQAVIFFEELAKGIDREPVGAESSEWLAEKGAADSCSFAGADLSGLNGAGASFKSCDLDNASFSSANLSRGEKIEAAKFDSADLSSVDFRGAALKQVSFQGATVTGITGLDAATLQGANFLDSKGLRGIEFARSNLTGVILPGHVESFGGVLQSVEQLTRQARILFATLMFACAYSGLALLDMNFENTDRFRVDAISSALQQGMSESGTVSERIREQQNGGVAEATPLERSLNSSLDEGGLKLPVIGVAVSRNVFFFVTPMLIFAFFLMFHLKFSRIWLEAKWLPHRFPDGRVVDRHLFPWIFASLVPGFLRTKNKSPSSAALQNASNTELGGAERTSHKFSENVISGVERGLAMVLGWVIVPVILWLFVWKQLHRANGDDAAFIVLGVPFEAGVILLANKLLLGIAIVLSGATFFQMYFSLPERAAKKTPLEPQEKDARRISVVSSLRAWCRSILAFFARIRDRVFRAFAITTIGIFALVVSNFNVALHYVSRGAPYLLQDATAQAVSDFADRLGYKLFARRIEEAGVTQPPPAASAGDSGKKFLYLSGAHAAIENVDLASAYIVRADFEEALLPGAIFEGAELHFVAFTGASLFGADFDNAKLQNVDFSGATGLLLEQFSGACDQGGTIMPADLPDLPACKGG